MRVAVPEAILLIEDDPDLGRIVRESLEHQGYTTLVARSAAAGLARLGQVPVGVVVLDLQLADLGGLELLGRIRARPAAPDLILLTGQPSLDTALGAIEAEAAGYLVKPFALSHLGELVARALERRGLVRENQRLSAELADRLIRAEAMLEISSTIGSTLDLAEALRRICRELVRLTGADTAAAYLHDRGRDLLVPTAAYHVPKEHLELLGGATIPLREQGLALPLWRAHGPVCTDDVPADPRFGHALFRQIHHQSGLVLPLVLDEEVAGAFYLIWWKARRAFGEEELVFLERVGGQVGLLLRNARLYEQAERARHRLDTLYAVARRLAGVHETDRILSLILEEATRLLGAQAAGIRLVEGDDLVVGARTEAAAGIMARPRLRIGESLSGIVVATGEPLAVEDLAEDTRHDRAHKQAALERGLHGFLGVPLRAHGQMLGVLNLFTARRRRFQPEEVSLLAAFADQASLAIEQGRLLREAEQGRQLLERLHEVAISMQTSWDRADRLRAFVRGAHEVVGFDRVDVLLATPDGSALELAQSHGEGTARPPTRLPLSPAAGVFHQAFQSRRPVAVLCDADLEQVRPLAPAFRAHPFFRTRRFVVAPLVVGDRAVGVVCADNKRTRRPIPQTCLEPLRLLCQQLAMALEEARLYEEAEGQRTRLGLIFDSTSDGIVLVGRDGRIEAANQRAAELFGFGTERAAGSHLVDALAGRVRTPAHAGQAEAAFHALLAAPEPGGRGELEIVDPSRRVLAWVGRPTTGATGTTIGLTLTFQDITEEREVSQMKSDFVSFVTHQLRTPLAGIKWLLELAVQGGQLPEAAASYVEDAREANERLIRLVNDLLNVSRLESGKIAIKPEAVDLRELTAGVVDELRLLVAERGHRLSIDSEDAVPRVVVDPQLLRQAVLNLISNAIKYTRPGGEIAVRIAPDGGAIRWLVRDSGIGVPREAQGRLFEKFFRADNVMTMETEGTGLGLYLVRLIVEQCGGRIWCESEEGRGSTFAFTLPPSTPAVGGG